MGAANERDKRWAIAPPPSMVSTRMGISLPSTAAQGDQPGEDSEPVRSQRTPRFGSYRHADSDATPPKSSVNELFLGVEPHDSERVTEVPVRADRELDTIPAPDWGGEELA